MSNPGEDQQAPSHAGVPRPIAVAGATVDPLLAALAEAGATVRVGLGAQIASAKVRTISRSESGLAASNCLPMNSDTSMLGLSAIAYSFSRAL